MSYIGPNKLQSCLVTSFLARETKVIIDPDVVSRVTKFDLRLGGAPQVEPDDPVDVIVDTIRRLVKHAGQVVNPVDVERESKEFLSAWGLSIHAVACAQAHLRLRAFSASGLLDPALIEIATALDDGAVSLNVIEGWVRRHTTLPVWNGIDQLNLFAPSLDRAEVQAYLAGSLTQLPEGLRGTYMVIQESVAWILADFGIRSYMPALHTSPTRFPDLNPAQVHDVDYLRVLDADVVVAMGGPSLGTGKELAWAEANGALTVLVPTPECPVISRLPLGSPAHVQELSLHHEPPEVALGIFLQRHAARLANHARVRRSAHPDLRAVCERLRSVQRATDEALQGSVNAMLTSRRAAEISSSPMHLLCANIRELKELQFYSKVDLSVLLGGTRSPNSPRALSLGQCRALELAARAEGWGVPRVLRLIHAAQTGGPASSSGAYLSVARRPRFADADDWIQFSKELEGGETG